MGDSLENPGAAVNGFDITAAQKKSGESQTQGPHFIGGCKELVSISDVEHLQAVHSTSEGARNHVRDRVLPQ